MTLLTIRIIALASISLGALVVLLVGSAAGESPVEAPRGGPSAQ